MPASTLLKSVCSIRSAKRDSPVIWSIRQFQKQVADGGAGFVVGGALRQLIIAAESLVDARDLLLIFDAVRRCAVVKCAASAGDVELAGDQIVPDRFQRREQRFVAGLGVDVGGAGIEICRADGVAVGDGLLAEGDAILVVVVALW